MSIISTGALGRTLQLSQQTCKGFSFNTNKQQKTGEKKKCFKGCFKRKSVKVESQVLGGNGLPDLAVQPFFSSPGWVHCDTAFNNVTSSRVSAEHLQHWLHRLGRKKGQNYVCANSCNVWMFGTATYVCFNVLWMWMLLDAHIVIRVGVHMCAYAYVCTCNWGNEEVFVAAQKELSISQKKDAVGPA